MAEEGELTEEELPEEVMDRVEGNMSKDRQHYVVGGERRGRGAPRASLLHEWFPSRWRPPFFTSQL